MSPPQAGGKMFIQVHSRSLNLVMSFETVTPFDRMPVWRDIRKLSLAEQEASAARSGNPSRDGAGDQGKRRAQSRGGRRRAARRATSSICIVMDKATPPWRSVQEIADAAGKDPVDCFIELALAKNLKQFFLQPLANENQDHVLEMMRHPRSVVTFSDSGAHVSQIMDSSLQTHVLSHWVRDKQEFSLEEAIRMLTFVPASNWGLCRTAACCAPGWAADVIVFDPEKIAPMLPTLDHDLPAGARRLKQKATGLKTTIVNGQVLLKNNEHTGALPGQLLRGPLASRA